ncbi:phosphonate ABC transporter, permease protein PhnE [Holzapfeliella sp. JNUCC 80]
MQQPLPRKPFKLSKWVYTLIILLSLVYSSTITQLDFAQLFTNLGNFTEIMIKMCSPDWGYLDKIINPLLETIKMSILGTVIGAIIAFPYALLVLNNVVKNKCITGSFRFVMNIIRTIPNLLLGAIFVAIIGIGAVTGVLALAVFTFGMVAKLFYEAIETIDEGPIEALTAVGASRVQIIRYAVLPQVMSYYVSYVLYAFEINVRSSTVLGYIGAGGIGLFLERALGVYRYDRVGLIVLMTFIVILIIDEISNRSREVLTR